MTVRQRHVFVLGLTDLHEGELSTVRDDDVTFHGLLDYDALVSDSAYDFDALLDQARAQLAEFDGPVDAILTHWDFPTSVLGPMLAAERGLPAPSLTSVLRCEHKYWSRLEQRAAVPEVVPAFTAFDPFADRPLDHIDLDFPFWVKPIKAHSSNLGFKVTDAHDLDAAVEQIRAEITGVGDAFDQVLRRVDLPQELGDAGGSTCLAEEVVEGIQVAPEGSMSGGHYAVHGVFDMRKDSDGLSIRELDYPAATVPQEVQQRCIDTTERLLRHIGYDDACFNAEYMWDESTDTLRMIEVNTRISQSHSDLFAKVDGRSNHQVALDVALGKRPRMPHREGRFAVAAQHMVVHDEDAVVRRVPDERDLERIADRFPGTEVAVKVQPGDRLSDLPHQDSYRYVLATVYAGDASRDALASRLDQIERMLTFDLENR
ncbi:ATP-binding protein [Luteipulveratus halotolerans]|uniref:ATP-grasp domain-containing protein n=1 Tax=Luteipulveratus halotolerans TaxID=1631356 RepID=A0A0L6CLU7_9MICO|nr:hypothetical protein [Luteipulveratus halotolerans]KNX38709.1 hypothetical protein VV01_18695 [Luteipulveratus halotolerans]